MKYLKQEDVIYSAEYGGKFGRIFPLGSIVETPPWGGATLELDLGKSTPSHSHDEFEVFLFTEGSGIVTVEDKAYPVSKGDRVFMQKGETHNVTNTGNKSLVFTCIWWS